MSFPRHGWASLSFVVLLAMVWPNPAGAGAIKYNFTGTVTESLRISGVNVGDRFSGTMSYDSDLPRALPPDPSDPPPPSIGAYRAPKGTDLVRLEVNVGSHTFRIENPDLAGVIVAHDYSDGFFFGTPSDFLMVTVADMTGRKFMDLHLTGLPGLAFTSTDLPTSLDLSLFPGENGISFSDNDDLDADFIPVLFGGSIETLTPVPEPTTMALLTLATLGYGYRLSTRKSGRSSVL